jgi:hypothetical protein
MESFHYVFIGRSQSINNVYRMRFYRIWRPLLSDGRRGLFCKGRYKVFERYRDSDDGRFLC